MSTSIFPNFNTGQQATFTVEITDDLSKCFADLSVSTMKQGMRETLQESVNRRQTHHLLVVSMIGNWLYHIIPDSNAQCVNIHYEFLSPINLSDHIDTVIELLETDEQKHLVTLRINCFNQAKTQVITGQAVMLVHQ